MLCSPGSSDGAGGSMPHFHPMRCRWRHSHFFTKTDEAKNSGSLRKRTHARRCAGPCTSGSAPGRRADRDQAHWSRRGRRLAAHFPLERRRVDGDHRLDLPHLVGGVAPGVVAQDRRCLGWATSCACTSSQLGRCLSCCSSAAWASGSQAKRWWLRCHSAFSHCRAWSPLGAAASPGLALARGRSARPPSAPRPAPARPQPRGDTRHGARRRRPPAPPRRLGRRRRGGVGDATDPAHPCAERRATLSAL